jgi:hypothetical protein
MSHCFSTSRFATFLNCRLLWRVHSRTSALTNLSARTQERMYALSIAAIRVPKSSVASPLASKRVIQWQFTLAAVACLIFDVKTETLIDARERRLTEDNRFESSLRGCSWKVGAANSSRKTSKCVIPRAISPSANTSVIPVFRRYRYEFALPSDPK